MPAIRNNNEQIDKTAGADRHATDDATRIVSIADQTAKAGEFATRAGMDIARQSVETARNTLESGLNTAVQSFQHVTDQFTRMVGFAAPQAEELARRSSQNIDAISQASRVMAKGAQEISRELFGLTQDRFARDLDGLNRLVSCRSVQDFVAVQSDLVRDRLGQAVESSRRIAEVSARVAKEAAGAIQVHADRNTSEVERSAEHARRVA